MALRLVRVGFARFTGLTQGTHCFASCLVKRMLGNPSCKVMHKYAWRIMPSQKAIMGRSGAVE